MVKMRMKITMKRNKIKKHQKHSRKHKKRIYSRKLRGGDICLKEVTDKIPPDVNRIGDENTNLPKKTSWGFGTLFGNKKTDKKPNEEVKIIDEKTENIVVNPLISTDTEETSIVPPPPPPPGPPPSKVVINPENIKPPPPPPPPPKKNELSNVEDLFKKGIQDEYKNTGVNSDDNSDYEFDGGKSRQKNKSNRKKGKNTRRKMKK